MRDDSEDIYIGADPEPYLFEPEYTEDGSYLGYQKKSPGRLA